MVLYMPKPKLDALVSDYNTKINALKKANRASAKRKVERIEELESKTQAKIDRLEKQRDGEEGKLSAEAKGFYEEFGAKKSQIENRISRETKHLQDWTTKYTQSKDIVDKLVKELTEKVGNYDGKLGELDKELKERQDNYQQVIDRLKYLDKESIENYKALNELPPLDIPGLTHESSDKRSAFTNKILWVQITNTNEIFKLSYEKIELDKQINKLKKRIKDTGGSKEKYSTGKDGELKEPRATMEYNQKNMKKYQSKLDATRKELQALLDTEEPFKTKSDKAKKKLNNDINAKIAKLKAELPGLIDEIKREHEETVANNNVAIQHLEEQVVKAQDMEVHLKKRLKEISETEL